jgi:hypothetical protein
MRGTNKKRYRLLILAVSVFFFSALKSQSVWESQNNEIYNYLYRMAQKGLLVFNDNIRPLSRTYLEQCLDSVSAKAGLLTPVEKKELIFYRKEYSDIEKIDAIDTTDRMHFFSKDKARRDRFAYYNNNHFVLQADPVITAATFQSNQQHVKQYSSGINLHGYAGKHWAYYFSLNDVNEKGPGLDTTRQFTPATGINTKIAADGKSQNYTELRAGIAYSWNNGSLSFGQDQPTWGYGENGRIVLSGKSPAYPYIRFDYQPTRWLHFNYMHAWLNSDILDSARTYSTGVSSYGGQRQFYISKFMAMHSIQFTPTRGLDITVGESIIYSDRLDIGYLVPISFFKVYDNLVNNNNINAGSNGQLFFQVSSRNNIRKTHLYGTLFIDEIRIGAIFNDSSRRNQLGYTLGASITDIFIPYLTMGLEYTRINPFVYRNLIPAQNYTSSNYVLGDWMGNNADRWIYTLRYTPAPKLKCLFRYQFLRKGSPGTLDQQYFQQPEPPFLFGLQSKQTEYHLQCSYEWINKLYLNTYFNSLRIDNRVTGLITTENVFSIGMSYGL